MQKHDAAFTRSYNGDIILPSSSWKTLSQPKVSCVYHFRAALFRDIYDTKRTHRMILSSTPSMPRLIQPSLFSPDMTSTSESCNNPSFHSIPLQNIFHSNEQQSRAKGFRRQRLYDVDRQAICEYEQSHVATHDQIAMFFCTDRTTVTKILKDKERWLNVNTQGQGFVGPNRMRSKKRRPKFPIIEAQMEDWLQESMRRFYSSAPNTTLVSTLPNYSLAPPSACGPLSDAKLREKAIEIARLFGISEEDFKASTTWLSSFKYRHGISNGFWTKYSSNITPCDEVGLDFAALPWHSSSHMYQASSTSSSVNPTSFLPNFNLQPHSPHSPPGHVTQSDTSNQRLPQPASSSNPLVPTHAECIVYLAKLSRWADSEPGRGILSTRERGWLRKLEAQFIEAGNLEAPVVFSRDD